MPVPVLSVAQMREWEAASWAAGIDEAEVIARVGGLVAQRVWDMIRPGQRVLLLAGKGHNGDDVRQALPHLHKEYTKLIDVTDPVADLPAIRAALAQQPELIVDGLFGIGLNRPLDDAWQRLIGVIKETNLPVLAVDTPSGLDADTGEVQGAAIAASVTLSVGAPKRGLLQPEAAKWVGRLEVTPNIGLIPCPAGGELQWTLGEDFKQFPPRRPVSTHKGSRGHLAIMAGSMGFHGAAVLAANGALRAQPGLVSLYTQEDVYVPVASQLAQAMVQVWDPAQSLPQKCTAVLCGPGLASPNLPTGVKECVRTLWTSSPLPVVVDASALDWLPEGPVRPDSLRVITPHPGEAARMLGVTNAAVQQDRVKALRELSSRCGRCWVVLKGHQTLVGNHTGAVFVNPTGNPHLAQGGSGDVLAGFLAGLLAQPALQIDACQALRYAVWRHGEAADSLQAACRGWTMQDLCGELG